MTRDRHADRRRFFGEGGARRFLRQTTTRRIAWTGRNVRAWAGDPALVGEYRRALPLVVAGVIAASLGAWWELLRPTRQPIDVSRLRRVGAAIAAPLPAPSGEPPVFGGGVPGQLLSKHRVLAYYGHSDSARMGILGEHDMPTGLAKLRDQATAYTAADPIRPVVPAFALIAAIADPVPGPDGLYRHRTADDTIAAFAAFTAEHGAQLILDLQPGRSPVADEIAAIRSWLEMPHVHLALDAEWAMGPNETPGSTLGKLDAATIAAVQRQVAALVAERGLPPKLLIVHQFKTTMIRGKAELVPVRGVHLVIDADGFGSPAAKRSAYYALVRDQPVEYAGIKLFRRQDQPLMTPGEVVALLPAPDVVIYQ